MENLTLIIPAKNEKESLPSVLNELKKFDLKILVVLEKSDKETIESIKDFNCEILYQINKGYGDALIHGINNTKTKYFCIFNADGSFIPEELKGMNKLLDNNIADFVFGSRYMKDASSDDDTLITYVGNKIFSFLGNVFFFLKNFRYSLHICNGKYKPSQVSKFKRKEIFIMYRASYKS